MCFEQLVIYVPPSVYKTAGKMIVHFIFIVKDNDKMKDG
jgi:hypothetical protein